MKIIILIAEILMAKYKTFIEITVFMYFNKPSIDFVVIFYR